MYILLNVYLDLKRFWWPPMWPFCSFIKHLCQTSFFCSVCFLEMETKFPALRFGWKIPRYTWRCGQILGKMFMTTFAFHSKLLDKMFIVAFPTQVLSNLIRIKNLSNWEFYVGTLELRQARVNYVCEEVGRSRCVREDDNNSKACH